MKENPNIKVETFGLLNVREKGLDKQYGFLLSDLEKHVYLIFNNKLIRGDK
jgi:hypothetical protein